MQGDLGDFPREHAIGAHRSHDVVRLGGHDDVAEAAVLEMAHVFLDGRGHLLGKRQVGPRLQGVVERPRVHADADGDAGRASRIDDGVGLFPRSDVTWIDAQLGRAATGGLDGDPRIEMDVGDDGKRAFAAYLLEGVQTGTPRDRHAHDLAADGLEVGDLTEVGLDVGRRRVEHRLHDARGAAAERHAADGQAPRALVRLGRRGRWFHKIPLPACIAQDGRETGARCAATSHRI